MDDKEDGRWTAVDVQFSSVRSLFHSFQFTFTHLKLTNHLTTDPAIKQSFNHWINHPGHLHWLLVCRRIQYKIALLRYKGLLTSRHTSETVYTYTNHCAVFAQPVRIFYVFLSALLISVDVPSVFPLPPFETNYCHYQGVQHIGD